jgi:hypothetical protein
VKKTAIDFLSDPRNFARFTVATTALTTRALANGNRIVIRVNQRLCWLYPDGRCVSISAEKEDDTKAAP